jgi:protocatechuate 3,4-dioxygenase beta subunit
MRLQGRAIVAASCALLLAALFGRGVTGGPILAGAQPLPTLTLAAPGEPGERMVLSFQLVARDGMPLSNVRVHAYQTDASGQYTRERPMDEPHARLGGWLTLPAGGGFTLHSIRPGGYPRGVKLGGRDRHIPAHVHLDVEVEGRMLEHWQMVFADDSLLADPYWREWVKKLRQPVMALERERNAWRGRLQLIVALERPR